MHNRVKKTALSDSYISTTDSTANPAMTFLSVCPSVVYIGKGLFFHISHSWKTVNKTVISNISTIAVTSVLPTYKGMKIAIISGRDKFPNGQAWLPASPPVTPSL